MYTAEQELGIPSSRISTRRTGKWAGLDVFALVFSLAVVAVICFGQSGMKRFWYDELITLRVAGLPTLGAILRFYESGKDTTSFIPAMLVHVFQRLPGRLEMTTRLPFTLAYLVTCLCSWVFLRRRYSTGYATAAVMLLAQGWTLYFASEIRAYAFVVMGTAIALVCWQAANERGRFRALNELGVFVGLSVALLFHFFAIFLLIPFLLAEWYVRASTGLTRRGMWLAILLFPATIAIMLPNMLAARHIYGKNFWSKPSIGLLTANYTVFMEPATRDLAEIALLIAAVLWFRRRRAAADVSVAAGESVGFSRAEWVLLLAFSLLPFFAYAGAEFLGVYRTQYLLYFQTGMLALLVGGLAEVVDRRRDAGWALAFIMLLLLVMHNRDRLQQGFRELAGKPVNSLLPSEFEAGWADYLDQSSLPVVAEGADTLLIALQYAPSQVHQRMSLLTSHARAEQQPKSLTNEQNMEVFGRLLKFPVQDYDQYVAQHQDFLLLVDPEQVEFGWVFDYLVNESLTKHDVHLNLVWGAEPIQHDQIFLVHFDRPSSASSAQ